MKKVKKFLSLSLMVVCLMVQSISVFAAENDFIEVPAKQTQIIKEDANLLPSALTASLETCDLGIGISGNGISVTFTTRATATASQIGIKNAVLQEKTLFGWKDIPISSYYTTNSDFYNGSVVYTQAVAGKTYRASCTHYAIINGQEYTLYNQTSELVYN